MVRMGDPQAIALALSLLFAVGVLGVLVAERGWNVAASGALGAGPDASGSLAAALAGRRLQEEQQQNDGTGLVINAVNFLIMAVFALFYKGKVVDQLNNLGATPFQRVYVPEPGKGLAYQLFDCFSEMQYCLHSCFCHLARDSHTAHVSGFSDFWMYCLLAGLFECLCSCCWCIPSLLLRMHVKAAVGVASNPVEDCILTCLCCPCTTGQVAMVMDQMMDISVSCCCQVDKKPPMGRPKVASMQQQAIGGVIGMATAVAQPVQAQVVVAQPVQAQVVSNEKF